MPSRNLSNLILGTLASIIILVAQSPAVLAQSKHTLPLVMPAGSEREGLIRVTNHSDRDGTVTIHAIDDSGRRFGPVTLPVRAKATAQFFSTNLESGGRGLSAGVGDGTGYWRLELETDLDIEPLSYIRTPDKFLIGVHDVVQGRSMRWQVPFFNSADALDKQSVLRVVNISGDETEVVIEGRDDTGAPAPGGSVRLSLPAEAARMLTAQMLERGDPQLDGSLGDGLAKWNLTVSAKRPLIVMGLLSLKRTGHLANLSTVTGDGVIRGGPGDDELWGGSGDDVIDPGDNADGVDIVHGSAGSDRIVYTASGMDAHQILRYSDPDTGGDYLGEGGITATIDAAANRATVVKGAGGTDTIVDIENPLNAARYPPYGGFGIRGTSSADVFNLKLDGQWMSVEGAGGADRFAIAPGHGYVRLNYAHAPNGIDIDLGAGRASNDGHGAADTIDGDVWEVVGSDASDVIRGSSRRESFNGRLGSDTIDGGGGFDRLYFTTTAVFGQDYGAVEVDLKAGTATGTLEGRSFSWTISNIEHVRGGAGNDTLLGSDGSDLLDGRDGDDVLNPRSIDRGVDRIYGSAGNDRIVYTDSGERAYQDIDYMPTYDVYYDGGLTVSIDGAANRATVVKGTHGTDTIVGIANPLEGWGFAIRGTSSDDVFNLTLARGQWMSAAGGPGNDAFNVRSDGSIRISYTWPRPRTGIDIDLGAGRANDDGFGDVDTISGNVTEVRGTDLSDRIRGSDRDESFIGRAGNDVIDGGGGRDRLRFDRSGVGAVNVDLAAGTATGTWGAPFTHESPYFLQPVVAQAAGGAFSYTISNIEDVRGSNGDDRIVGDAGANELRGRSGDDTIEGGGGDDTIEGGGGDDTYVFGPGHGKDYIRDFTDGQDVILLFGLGITKSDVLANSGPWSEGTGVWIDLTAFGGGSIDLGGFDHANLDASDFLL